MSPRRVYVICTSCISQIQDSSHQCDKLVKCLKSHFVNTKWNTIQDIKLGGSLIEEHGKIINESDKVLILWTPDSKSAYESRPHRNNDEESSSIHLLCYILELADCERAEKAIGNFIIHVALEHNSVPQEFKKWLDIVHVKEDGYQQLKEKIQETPIEQKDLSPCGHLATGLSWTFLVKYLMRVWFPQEERFACFSKRLLNVAKNLPEDKREICPFLIEIIPRSGICPDSVLGLRNANRHLEVQKTAGGNEDRSYKITEYEIQDGDQKYYAAVEYVTPVRAMYHMCQHTSSSMTREWLVKEVEVFLPNLLQLCDEYMSKNEKSQLKFIDFDDMKFQDLDKDSYTANTEIAEQLRQQILKCIKANLPSQDDALVTSASELTLTDPVT